jgi:hypothetical protein
LTEPPLTPPRSIAEAFSIAVPAAEEAPERTSAVTSAEAPASDSLPELVARGTTVASVIMMMMTTTEPKTRCIKKHI